MLQDRPGHPPSYLNAALRHLRNTGDPMGQLIDRHGPPPFRRTTNAFRTLTRSIVFQQLAGSAAKVIYGRFLDIFPARRFPTPRALCAVPSSKLRQAGLSEAKSRAVRDLAEHFCDGRIDPRVFRKGSEEQIMAMLTPVRGIGPWSVHMFLMFGLNRSDVLPVGDYGVQKGMQTYFRLRKLPSPSRMIELSKNWQPYRSVATWYMYRVAENR